MDATEVAAIVGARLERLGVDWVLGGSLASSVLGEPRSTVDIDIAVTMSLADVESVVDALIEDFYIDRDMVVEAVTQRRSFNVIHYPSVTKVDIFVLGESSLDRAQMADRWRLRVGENWLWVGAAETQVVRKLVWFREGGSVSDRQWRDVVGLLSVQSGKLDMDLLRRYASEARVADLLEHAILDATDPE